MLRFGRLDPTRERARAAAVRTLVALLALAGGAAAAPAWAQEPPEDDATRLDSLRVEVTRVGVALDELPLAVSVVSLDDAPVPDRRVSLDGALGRVPGVFVQNRRNFSLGDRVTMRGTGARSQFGVRGVQVILDGVPLTLPDGQSALGNLDLATAGRVELIRGPASALYGNASGGVIRVRTMPAGVAPVGMEAAVAGASHGFLDTRFRASGRDGRFGWLAGVRRVETDGFREYAAAERYAANLVARYGVAPETELGAVVNLDHLPFAENPSSLDRETARDAPATVRDFIIDQGAGETHTQAQAGVSLRHEGAATELNASLWGLRRSVRNPIPGTIIDLSRGAAGARLVLTGRTDGGPRLRWTVGADAALQHDDRMEFVNEGVRNGGRAVAGDLQLDQRERVLGFGPFAQSSLRLGSGWTVTLAARYDVYDFDAADRRLEDGDDSGSRTLTRLSPMAGVVYGPIPEMNLYANFSTAFETPTTSELSNDPSGAGGFNPELRPEVLRSFEAGVRGGATDAGLSYAVSAYRGTVDDALVPYQGATEEVFFRNAGRVSRDGIEAELGWAPGPWLRLSAAWTLQDFVLEEFVTDGGDFSGRREPGVPRHRVAVGAGVRLPSDVRLGVDFEWVDAFPVDDANDSSNPAYRVVDLRIGWRADLGRVRLRPFLGVENLLDERYAGSVAPNAFGERYYEPAPGRELYGGVEFPVPGLDR
ncbi:MAG: TonB-dependent receptor [Gemmatimonadota bacterium]